MDTPTRERIEALEARVKELEAEVAALRGVAGAVSVGPTFATIASELERSGVIPIKASNT